MGEVMAREVACAPKGHTDFRFPFGLRSRSQNVPFALRYRRVGLRYRSLLRMLQIPFALKE